VKVDSHNVNLELVAEGWAWHFVRYSKAKALTAAEAKARDGELGLQAGAARRALGLVEAEGRAAGRVREAAARICEWPAIGIQLSLRACWILPLLVAAARGANVA